MYAVGDLQFSADTRLLDARLLQFAFTSCKTVDDKEEYQQSREHHQRIEKTHTFYRLVDLIVIVHGGNDPVRFFSQRGEENTSITPVAVIVEIDASASFGRQGLSGSQTVKDKTDEPLQVFLRGFAF